MLVTSPNDVKIYNLSAGKSIPEFLSKKKIRALQKKDVDFRKRIQLIQDFEMPDLSNCIKVSKDGQYILATGVYKPRVRCFDVNQLSMKFDRCFDAEVINFEILSDDYGKMVFLQDGRYLEFHVPYGRYFRMRIPKYGRDLTYHPPSCDLYCVGSSSEIYRFNLERGRFMNSLQSNARAVNVCEINPVHHLFVCGTAEGRVEAWDPRNRNRVGILDCALSSVTEHTIVQGFPEVTSLTFRDGLRMAVGTKTGQILVFDIRSSKPLLVKDHMYGLPINDIEFYNSKDLILSMDEKICKLWDGNTGKPYTSIQGTAKLNDLCVLPNTGLLFLANEDKKILSYYIPSLGPAPKWCSFLDNLIEELEESYQDIVYDDYKFITKEELNDLGVSHFIGTNLLKAYMHGYFMDIRLYSKIKSSVRPIEYDEFKKKKIKQKIEADRVNRVKKHKLPLVNKELAQKLYEDNDTAQTKNKDSKNILHDARFKALFHDSNFEIDKECDEYKLLKPVSEKRKKKKKSQPVEIDEEMEGKISSEESSSDDNAEFIEEIKKQHRKLKQKITEPKFYSIIQKSHDKPSTSLGELLEKMDSDKMKVTNSSVGNKTVTFTVSKNDKQKKKEKQIKEHLEERRKLRRSAKSLEGKSKHIRRYK